MWHPEGKEGEGATVRFDMTDSMIGAHVFTQDERGGRRTCPRLFDRYVCDKESWQHVSPRSGLFETGDARRCTWIPSLAGRETVLSFDDIPSGVRLRGYYGVPAVGQSRKPKPVDMSVRVDGVEVFSASTTKHTGASPFDVALDPEKDTVDLQVRVSARAPSRHNLCMNLQLVDASSRLDGAGR